MATQLQKWLGYYSPLFQGRFDVFLSAGGPRREAWHQGLGLSNGRFWMRIAGGHDLRRTTGPAPTWAPTSSDLLVGRSDGRGTSLTTFPWVGHAAGTEYVHGLTAVGAGGVSDVSEAPRARAAFDPAGALVAPAPNLVGDLAVEPVSGGRFALCWTYDETDQETAPSQFRVYNDVGSFGIVDYGVVIAVVPYRFRRGYFSWTSAPFAHGSRVTWAVRAAGSAGAEGPPSPQILSVAAAALPPAPEGIRAAAAEG